MTDQPEQSRRITLNASETVVVNRHLDRITSLTENLSKIVKDDQRWWSDSRLDQQRYPPDHFKQPRRATTLAVLGPRGSGKSTCMVKILNRLRKLEGTETAVDSVNRRNGRVRPLFGFSPVEQVIDCSLNSPNVPFGLSVLMRLRHLLGLHRDPPENSSWSCEGEVQVDPNLKDEQRVFREMREAYMLTRSAAGRVLEGTSSTGSHFAQQASAAAAGTLALPDRVADWLQCAAKCAGPDVTGFVVVMDDVDLVRDGILDMVYSLLDELHQPRLIFIIGADLPALERRIADSLAGGRLDERDLSSDKSPRPSREEKQRAYDLLYKILPQVNREWLLPWAEKERWDFPPRPAAAYPIDSSLGDLLIDRKADLEPTFLTPALLPGYPRRLENLWFALATPRGTKEGNREPASLHDLGEFIAYLAEARGDYELARRIALRTPKEWGRTFRWEEEPIPQGMWDRLVDAALKNVSLSGIVAMSDDLPLPQDPSSAGLWTELLLDLSLASDQLTSAELIRRFPRMSDLVDQAQIRTDFHRDEMAQELRHVRGSIMAKLAWTRFDVTLDRHGFPPEEFDAQVGLAPLLEAVEGRRKVWPTPLVQGLFLQRSEVLDQRQRAYDTDGDRDVAKTLLPRAVRPLIVFIDSLSRAPWRALSETPRRRSFRINALLAAGLVRAAYVHTLKQMFNALPERGNVDQLARHAPLEADRTWLEAMEDRGDKPIVDWSDDDVEDRFDALLKEAEEERKAEKEKKAEEGFFFAPYNELVGCLRAYTKSRAFRDLADPKRQTERDGGC